MLSRSIRALRLQGVALLLSLVAISAAVAAGAHPARPSLTAAEVGRRGADQQTAVFAGGCFWGMEAVFSSLKGVTSVVSGFSGGDAATAHYPIVSTGMTGHAESVEITYDPSRISFTQLLNVFFLVAHDPTELNRQGPDEGSQYRSEIFYRSDAQRAEAAAEIRRLTAEKVFRAPIVTKLEPFRAFYPAEAYHQHFVQRNPDDPYVVANDLPKLAHLRTRFPTLVRPQS